MRKSAAILLLAGALPLALVAPGHAGRHRWHGHPGFRSRVVIGIGPAFRWGPPAPYWWYSPPPYSVYAPPPYSVYSPPPVLVEAPPVYVEAPPPPESYWYYCASARAYYPSVQSCREAWIKVPPGPPGSEP